MCARFTVLSDTPIAAAIAGCAIPFSRNNTIWMRWRCAAGIFSPQPPHLGFAAFDHLFPRIRWRSESHLGQQKQPAVPAAYVKNPDSSRYGGGISLDISGDRFQ